MYIVKNFVIGCVTEWDPTGKWNSISLDADFGLKNIILLCYGIASYIIRRFLFKFLGLTANLLAHCGWHACLK